jgi:cytochrome c peroxidase
MTAGIILVVSLGAFTGRWSPTPYPLHYPAYFGNRINITDNNPLTVEGVTLGRMLFYDPRLSANGKISCASCHQQARAFTDGRCFSEGFDGTPTKRNSMTLANLLWVRHFFWDGRAVSMEAQVLTPLTDGHEMGMPLDSAVSRLQLAGFYAPLFTNAFGSPDITAQRFIMALTQFERTLISDNAPYDRYIRGEYQATAAEKRGIDLFFSNTRPASGARSAGCGNCHGGSKTFNEMYHNNGLDRIPADSGRADVTGMAYDLGRFRVVTLRNIALTAPYMHDGRFKTLQEVIDHYSDHIEPSATLSPSLRDTTNRSENFHLTPQEKSDLLAFLKMLTDSTFITDPRYSDPFAGVIVKNKTKE